MKKLLLLLCALFISISGAWATNPAAGAYPVEGKTYYLFAQQTKSDTPRSYIYNNNGTLSINQGAKETTDAYKWTVTISDGTYTINNVADNTQYLNVDANHLILSTSSCSFTLNKDVHYSACVALYTNSKWWVTSSSTTTYSNNGYYLSSYGSSNDWTANYVFEEVLPAHSLVDGKYYTIYCDNDNKQYLYDNAGTLAQTSSAPASDLRYVWQCIVSGDYYNFRNLQTGKYLSHKTISSSANNFTIETSNVYHDGCVKLKTNTTYMGFTTSGGADQATASTYSKITTDYSYDFRFDAIDLSDWCIGDLLGGSVSGSDNWTNTWTSGTSPSFTLTATVNDINHKNDRTTGGLDIRSGSGSAGYDTYTITAPTGYLVTGYKLVGYALNGNQTVTPSKAGDATVFTTAGNSISVSGLRQGKATFKLSGANEGLFIRALQVSLAPIASSITSLPTANDKAYTIYNARAVWNFADGATNMNGAALGNIDLDNEEQQIALIYNNENYYLYSVNAGKYLTANNTLTSVVTENEQVSITATGNATYPWFFKFKNIENKNINIDGNRAVQINWYSTQDEGNRNAIIEAVDFDASEALAMFNNRYVTYNLSYGGNDTFRTESNVVVAIDGDPADYVPESWKAAYCTLTYDVETIEESTTTVNVSATWNGPFDFSTVDDLLDPTDSEIENANWYYMTVGNRWIYSNESDDQINFSTNIQDALDANTNALWAYVGNPIDGVRIINKAKKGSVMVLWTPCRMDATTGYTHAKIVNNNGDFKLIDDEGYYIYYDSDHDKLWTETNRLNSSSSTITVRSYYCQQALDNWTTYVGESTDKLFGVTSACVTSMESMILGFPKMTESEYNTNFATIPNANIEGDISYNIPNEGYYRIKNFGTNRYIAYGQPAATGHSYNLGLIAVDDANDISTVVKLTSKVVNDNVIPSTYALTTQGLNVQTMREGSTPFPATTDDMKYFVFNIVTPGVVSIQNIASYLDTNHTGCLHDTSWDITPGIVNWNAASDASKWAIEKAQTIEISLQAVGSASYATLFVDFPVAVQASDENTAIYIVTEDNGSYQCVKTTSVPAQTGIIIRNIAKAGSVTLDIPTSTEEDQGVLTGTLLGAEAGSNNYVFGYSAAEGIGFYPKTSGTIGANKAYLHTSNEIKGFTLSFDDETGIQEVNGEGLKVKDEIIFNLAGQRVAKAQKGLYIVNGKKVMVK